MSFYGNSPEALRVFENPDYNDTVGRIWAECKTREDLGFGNLMSNRDMFDSLHPDDVYWTPYEEYRSRLPPICGEERTTAIIPVPLVFFWIVEHYRPQRVMRQFGYRQKKLKDSKYNRELHDTQNFRGNDWPYVHRRYIEEWDCKWEKYSTMDDPQPFDPAETEDYLMWYRRKTDPLVQSTISHSTETYRPFVPEKRKAVIKFSELFYYFYMIDLTNIFILVRDKSFGRVQKRSSTIYEMRDRRSQLR